MQCGRKRERMKFEKEQLFWKNEPTEYSIGAKEITIQTEPLTDYWKRTYYGFCHDNIPTLLTKTSEKYFSFVVKTEYDYKRRFDHCGVMIYQDTDNAMKVAVEYEDENNLWLGCVVTNNGYSDWSTSDLASTQKYMYFRISRRESDFCVENSLDGVHYKQMRITHLFEGSDEINIGLFASSPEESSFKATFTEFEFTDCKWEAHS